MLRRAPRSGPLNTPTEPPTSILRRHPTGELPVVAPGPAAPEPATTYLPRAKPTAIGPTRARPADPRPAIAAAVVSILSGWATAVIATDLITGWWATDPLFCVAVGFLAAISAAASITGLIGLLLRRRTSRLLIVVGSVVALLIFASLFLAGAKLPGLVYAMPLLPVTAVVLTLLPGTARWSRSREADLG
ncbi:MAG: hypothetical protein AB7F42_30220 [Mycolicibacterium sp.]